MAVIVILIACGIITLCLWKNGGMEVAEVKTSLSVILSLSVFVSEGIFPLELT